MKRINWTPDYPDTNGWKARHMEAVANPERIERPIVLGIDGWVRYALEHRWRYTSPIGEDYVLGPAWARWGCSLHELLNGETGRLDCGTLDTIIRDNLAEMGYNLDE